MEDGIKYKRGEMYLMANNFDYKEEKVEEVEEDNDCEVEKGPVKKITIKVVKIAKYTI